MYRVRRLVLLILCRAFVGSSALIECLAFTYIPRCFLLQVRISHAWDNRYRMMDDAPVVALPEGRSDAASSATVPVAATVMPQQADSFTSALVPLAPALYACQSLYGRCVTPIDCDPHAARSWREAAPVCGPGRVLVVESSTLPGTVQWVRFVPGYACDAPAAAASGPQASLQPLVRHERMFKNGATLLSFIMSGWEVQYTRRPTYKEKPGTSPPWLLYWGGRWRPDPAFEQGMRGAHPAVDAPAGKCYGARVNHFPATYLLGRKDNLALQVQKLARRCQGDAALARTVRALIPPTYVIPRDLDRLRRLVEELAPSAERLIAKPAALSRGRGVTLFAASDGLPEFLLNPTARAAAAAAQDDEDGSEGGEDVPYVVQRYLADPLLVNGFKVDLRLYVVCTSFDPLKIFLYNDGLARFATEPYSIDATSTYAHITNYSINQQNENFVAPEGEGTGSKWTLHALQRHIIAERGEQAWTACWAAVHHAVVLTLISCEDTVASRVASSVRRSRATCFELFGFDIMLDSALKPTVIEVNVLPSLACDGAVDRHVKGPMLADLLTLVGPGVAAVDPSGLGRLLVDPPIARPAGRGGAVPRWDEGPCGDPNFFPALHAADRMLLAHAEEELARRGGFERIFPTPAAVAAVGRLLCTPTTRYGNVLLWWWESEKARHPATALAAWLQGGSWPAAPQARPKSLKSARPARSRGASVVR